MSPIIEDSSRGRRPGRVLRTLERPARPAKARWERVWLAEERGVPLPPVSVVRVGDGYALRDGHHRVSVARARGQATISAVVAAA